MKMKKLLIIYCSIFSFSTLFSQEDVTLRINHLLGNDQFLFNTEHDNNLSQAFMVTRLQYYVTRISIVYDGGQTLAISDDTVALINANDGAYSDIPLGNINVPNIESVKFHIGVFSPVNNADPSLYAAGHPLAPQSPSMHWGWASGYRFLVYEGKGGTNFAQTFQFHALDNPNYFETEVNVSGQSFNGGTYISIDGDYILGVDNVDVSSGIWAHGVNEEDLDVLINFRDKVFSASPQTLSIDQIKQNDVISIYPNPSSNGLFYISNQDDVNVSLSITNSIGKEIKKLNNSDAKSFHINSPGVYFVNIISENETIQVDRIVVN